MDFIYLNSNLSGIGDRLFDIILLYSFAKFIGCNNFYLNWKVNNNDIVGNESIYSKLRNEKTPYRSKDYLLENLQTYITFPDNIHFVNQNELNSKINNSNFIFSEYMGLQYSVFTFIEKFLPNISEADKVKFTINYYNNFKLFTFKNIPENIRQTFINNNVITIHLRRSDKVVDDGGVTDGIETKDLDELDLITKNFINNCIKNGNINICFISDEKSVKDKYIEQFKDKCNVIYFNGDEISQTYYDLYCLSVSKNILMSQMFSVFSIIGSLLGNKKTLYYIYNKKRIIDLMFNKYYNFKHIDEFKIINQVNIIIHQGIGDIFNSIGLINYYSTIYKIVNIIALNELNKNIINSIFENNKNIKCIIPSFINYKHSEHPNTCIICMTNGQSSNCPRLPNQECKYIDYNKLNSKIIKIGSFNNYSQWEIFKNKQFSFSDAFYLYNNLNINYKLEYFKLNNNIETENDIYDKLINKYGLNYILIHEDNDRNYFINRNNISNINLPIINLNKISNNFVDYTKVLLNAKEIHLIDSSWSVFIYLLSYKKLKNSIYLNETLAKNLGRDTNIYKNPTFSNWIFY